MKYNSDLVDLSNVVVTKESIKNMFQQINPDYKLVKETDNLLTYDSGSGNVFYVSYTENNWHLHLNASDLPLKEIDDVIF